MAARRFLSLFLSMAACAALSFWSGSVLAGAASAGTSSQSAMRVPDSVCQPGYGCSKNWSGYVSRGTTFTSATATWQVPAVAPSQSHTNSSTWLGVGGAGDGGALIQDGTQQHSSGNQTYYAAWWEVVPGKSNGLPNSQVNIGKVNPGDTVTTTLQENSPGTWTMTLVDQNAGINFSKTVSPANSSAEPTAEWIEEAPTTVDKNGDSHLDTLANYGAVQFQNIGATPATGTTMRPDEMTDDTGHVVSYPSTITNNAFTLTYGTPPPGPAPAPNPPGPGPTPTPTPPPPSGPTGYWMVGGDGGVFAFGRAAFYGSTGGMVLQRPVVGMANTTDFGGYWLVGSDGGMFAYGNSRYYGSIPGLGIAPAGSSGFALSAPIVGMAEASDNGGYYLVGADGGVFAFGDALFAGSCPSVGGCVGKAVAILPDGTGFGYWIVTDQGAVYAFGDAVYYGGPGPRTVGGGGNPAPDPVVSAVASPDGEGYWVLFASGAVTAFGDAANSGQPAGLGVGGANPARVIISTADGGGYWVVAANGAVFAYGDASYLGGMNNRMLNTSIIAGSGW